MLIIYYDSVPWIFKVFSVMTANSIGRNLILKPGQGQDLDPNPNPNPSQDLPLVIGEGEDLALSRPYHDVQEGLDPGHH